MSCTCVIPAITEFPFHRCHHNEVCLMCGSARENEYHCCRWCRKLKPLVDHDVIDEGLRLKLYRSSVGREGKRLPVGVVQ